MPKGFFPQEDTGFLIGITEAATDTSFEAMSVRQQALADVLQPDPAVDYINSHRRRGRPEPDCQLRPAVHRAEAERASASRRPS